MNHDETKAAIHLSLLMGDTKSERHDPLRKQSSTTWLLCVRAAP
jgi:hypothetical protein